MMRLVGPLVLLLAVVGAGAIGAALESASRASEGSTVLFDGRSTSPWRAYGKDAFPDKGWSIEPDGSLRVHAKSGAGDIITRETYGDFELELEFKVAAGANSGIFYRAVELAGKAVYWNAFEYQVLDDERHPDGKISSHRAGSLYDLYAAEGAVTKPVGEWNQARIVMKGTRIEHWLNDTRVVACDTASEDYRKRLAASKFATWKGYGTHAKGHVGLQDHGDDVWFRNVRIRASP